MLAGVWLFEAASLKEIDSDNIVQKFILEYSWKKSIKGTQVPTKQPLDVTSP